MEDQDNYFIFTNFSLALFITWREQSSFVSSNRMHFPLGVYDHRKDSHWGASCIVRFGYMPLLVDLLGDSDGRVTKPGNNSSCTPILAHLKKFTCQKGNFAN